MGMAGSEVSIIPGLVCEDGEVSRAELYYFTEKKIFRHVAAQDLLCGWQASYTVVKKLSKEPSAAAGQS